MNQSAFGSHGAVTVSAGTLGKNQRALDKTLKLAPVGEFWVTVTNHKKSLNLKVKCDHTTLSVLHTTGN